MRNNFRTHDLQLLWNLQHWGFLMLGTFSDNTVVNLSVAFPGWHDMLFGLSSSCRVKPKSVEGLYNFSAMSKVCIKNSTPIAWVNSTGKHSKYKPRIIDSQKQNIHCRCQKHLKSRTLEWVPLTDRDKFSLISCITD